MISERKTSFIFHLRPVPVLFVGILIGILLFTSRNIVVMILGVLLISAAAIGSAFIRKSKTNLKILAILFSFTCVLGILSSFLTQQTLLSQKIEGKNLYVEGIVSMDSDDKQIYLDNLKIGGEAKKGRAKVENVGFFDYGAGDRLAFFADVSFLDFDFYDSYSMQNYQKDLFFTMRVKELVTVEKGKTSLKESIKIGIYNIVYRYMDDEEAGLTMAMLFGDKKGLDAQTAQQYRNTGMAHIFAVSGLHASVIGGLIVWLLKKLKANRYVKFAALTLIMLFYCYLCSFTPSVLRAALMLIFYAFADMTGRYRCRISSVSAAALLILTFEPFALFQIGFLLSFAAYFGILFFAKPLSQFFAKFLPRKLSETIGLSIGVNIMIFPFSALYFQSFSVIFLIGNILLMPFLTFAFMTIVASLVAMTIIPFSGYLLTGVGFLFQAINGVNSFFAKTSFATAAVEAGAPFAILYLITCILVSRYNISGKKLKYTSAFVTGASAAALFVAGFFL